MHNHEARPRRGGGACEGAECLSPCCQSALWKKRACFFSRRIFSPTLSFRLLCCDATDDLWRAGLGRQHDLQAQRQSCSVAGRGTERLTQLEGHSRNLSSSNPHAWQIDRNIEQGPADGTTALIG